MPEQLFYELDIDKRNRIIDAGLREFAEQSYNEASTNRIVKAAGIGKGSLFKYFKNKEDFYFYVLDSLIADLVEDVKDDISSLKGDIFDIIIGYAEIEFNWHMNNPDKYKLMKRAFIEDNSVMFQKTMDRYREAGNLMYYNLLKDADTVRLKPANDKLINVLKWIIEGYNNDFNKKIDAFADIDDMKKMYIKELKEYMEIIKKGIYK
ncbi:TetR/AcrR family transcriptional regulator [Alkaliphilus peptidifermentans]|uniref:Transcriptional regulator, TetR family n=1 Tax=Alkaliphilus peptidifermentans DSM 18978 TaxID=1120976 RepID=A0A1G5L3J5_9FIRM|nr:TetR/AcrR family transcriptional regulator [Alkaliphilus peptidifermentans]SCZ07475.1 transcriptional regulator, TetR family [Alkaliphilus peptidifermentans DSM 18978]